MSLFWSLPVTEQDSFLTGDLAAYLAGRDGGVQQFVLLLEHGNLRRSRLSLLLEVSESTTYDDAAALLPMGWCRRGSSSAAPRNRAGMA